MTGASAVPWRLMGLLAALIAVPAAIAAATLFLNDLNAAHGFLRHRLPSFLFWGYAWCAVLSPIAALGALVVLWRRRRAGSGVETYERRDLRVALGLIIAALLAPILWGRLFGEVFFAAGGNR